MTTLIGFRCKHRKVLSREVLIRPFLLGNLQTTNRFSLNACACFKNLNKSVEDSVLVVERGGPTRSSFRTRPLSTVVAMVLVRGE